MSIKALNYFHAHAHARPILLCQSSLINSHHQKSYFPLLFFPFFFTLFRVKDFPYFKFI
jgi:hypothetical protein